jgi:ribosomal protein S18 acetylase RimI-like enzyme
MTGRTRERAKPIDRAIAMSTTVRSLTAADADAYLRMWGDFAAYLRGLGDTDEQGMTREKFLHDGFGPDPAFAGFIAELDREPAGYLLYHFGYQVDRAIRVLHVIDLWVDPAARRRGLGRALMSAAAQCARAKGAPEMVWEVFAPNRMAARFYERLGAGYVRGLDCMRIAVADIGKA